MADNIANPFSIGEQSNDLSGAAASQVSRRHHYVPAFLLAGFTPSGSQSDMLWSFDNERSRPEHRAPKAVAFELDYYAVSVPGQPPDVIENFFARVESIAAPIIRDMVVNRQLPTGEDFKNLMYFLGLMHGRSPAMRSTLIEFVEENMHQAVRVAASSLENFEAAIRGMPDHLKRPTFEMMQKWAAEEKFVEISNASPFHVQATMYGLDRGVPELLGQRKWSLLTTENENVPFVISDNPISIVAQRLSDRARMPPGLVYLGMDFILPIDRTTALLGRFEGRSKNHVVGDGVVACVNERTVASARRYVYAPMPQFHVMQPDQTIRAGSEIWLKAGD